MSGALFAQNDSFNPMLTPFYSTQNLLVTNSRRLHLQVLPALTFPNFSHSCKGEKLSASTLIAVSNFSMLCLLL